MTNDFGTFFADLGTSLLATIFNIIASLINIILLPINFLFKAFIPNFDTIIDNFNQFALFFISVPFNFFINLIPPLTRSVLLFYLGLKISYYTFVYAYRGIVLIPTIIRKIKFW